MTLFQQDYALPRTALLLIELSLALHTNQNEKGVLEMDIGHLLVSTVLMAASKDRYL